MKTAGAVLSAQLKRLYHEVSLLKARVSRENGYEALDKPRVMLDLLLFTLAHNVPVSLRAVPEKYNSFRCSLENLC